jgi:hypothetical protein
MDARTRLALGLVSSWLAVSSLGCSNTVSVDLSSGPQTFELAAGSFDVPAELVDPTTGRLMTIPCPTGVCPSTAELPLACRANVCDPEPVVVSAPVGDVIDFDVLLREGSVVLRVVETLEVTQVSYSVTPNTLTVTVPETEIFWGPEGAAGVDSPGVTLLGTMPLLPPATMQDGEMTIDANGSRAMSDYVLGPSRRVRFFARTTLDLAPGDPVPSGAATATVNLTVRASGRIVR